MNRILLFFAFLTAAIAANAQFKLTLSGTCVDEKTGNDYVVFDAKGTQKELYDRTLKLAYELANDPKSVTSTIPDELISLFCVTSKTIKYFGMNQSLKVRCSIKFQFKDNKIKTSIRWIDAWHNDRPIDLYTLLAYGSWKCFNKKGEIISEKWFNRFNPIANELVDRFINPKKEDEW